MKTAPIKGRRPWRRVAYHIGYWVNGRWTPWCEAFPEANWPRGRVKAVPADLCPDCLALALEESAEEGG